MREQYHMVDGRRVRSVVAGAGGPVVVLVPGLGAVGYLLDTLAGCAAWSRAHLLDVPGFGHAPPRPCPPEIPAMAATVSGWLDAALPGAEVVLAGHSTGAQVAVHVAVARPGRVRALALLGPTFPPAQRRLPAAALAAARTLPRERPGVVRGTVPYYVRAGARTMARFVRSAQRDEPEHLVARLTCPTLVARGEHDRFAPPEWTGHLAATAPKGWCLTVPGAHTFPYGQGGMTSGLIAEAANAAGAATAPWERPGHDHRRTGPAGDH